MTRSRTPRTQAPPLADTLRAALAQGWHSLAALDALAGGTVSTRRARVHAALTELAAAGVAREERMGSTGAEVRLAPVTMPAPMPDDGDDGLDAEDREAARVAVEDAEAAPCEPSTPVEAADAPVARDNARPVNAMSAHLAHYGHVEEAREVAGLPPAATREPGPSSRCAVCDATYVKHESLKAGHAFTPKPRGRPRVAVAPIPDAAPAVLPRARQRRERGPVVDVDGGRVERASCPPCIDCGEERGTCPEGRCRDCDIEHLCASGSCRECLVWIVREEVAGPLSAQHRPGCSLATAEDWRPRDAAELASVRARREEAPTAEERVERFRSRATPETRALLDAVCDEADARLAAVTEHEATRGESDGPREQCPSVWHDERCEREAGHPCDASGHHETADRQTMWTSDAAERWAKRVEDARLVGKAIKPRRMRARIEGGAIVAYREPPPCRPPACHRDDIHEPSGVRGFARPLCERHRRWVEEAGGTLAAGGLAGVVRAP